MGVRLFLNFFPSSLSFELRSEGKVEVNQVRKRGKTAPGAGPSMHPNSVVGGDMAYGRT